MMKITLMPGKMSLPRLYWDYVTNCQSQGTNSEEGLSETSTINKVISCIDEEFVMFLFKINLREQYSITSINDKQILEILAQVRTQEKLLVLD